MLSRYLRRQLVQVLMLMGLMLLVGTDRAQAQILDQIEVNIPFEFYAGNSRLPAGKYMVKVLDGTYLTVMEIAGVNGHHSAVFEA